jgi:hypothetical protein
VVMIVGDAEFLGHLWKCVTVHHTRTNFESTFRHRSSGESAGRYTENMSEEMVHLETGFSTVMIFCSRLCLCEIYQIRTT